MSRKRHLSLRQDQYSCKGAFVSLQQLLDQRHAAKSLELQHQSRSRLGMSGTHISKTKGRGVDFEEYRAYQPGDDIRNIDWRVTARVGRPFTKIFREERERPVIIGVDQSHSMFFGSQVAFKSVLAAEAAAIICWNTIDNGDRVGGVVFSDEQQDLVKPRRGKRSALRFLNCLADYNQELLHQYSAQANASNKQQSPDKHHLRSALEQMYRITRHGSSVYLISDFRDFDETCQQYLQQLSMHNNVTCIYIYDILEESLPKPGVYSITDGVEKSSIDTHSGKVREIYHQEFESHLAELSDLLNKMKVPLMTLKTNQSVLEKLEKWKHKTL